MGHDLKTRILVVGNYCHDTLLNPAGRFEVLGGSSSYISAILTGLQIPFRVVAKVGEDFLYRDQVVQAPLVVPGVPTTHFVDETVDGVRVSFVRARCAPIHPDDLGEERVPIGLACGIAGELLPATLRRMRELCEVVIADAQGLLRTTDAVGRVRNRPLRETDYLEVLPCIDYLKCSLEESRFVDRKDLGNTRMLLTDGARGSRLIEPNRELSVSPFPTEEIDSTGAGDCFVAGFAEGLLRGLSAAEATRRGNYFGSLAVQQIGVPRIMRAELSEFEF